MRNRGRRLISNMRAVTGWLFIAVSILLAMSVGRAQGTAFYPYDVTVAGTSTGAFYSKQMSVQRFAGSIQASWTIEYRLLFSVDPANHLVLVSDLNSGYGVAQAFAINGNQSANLTVTCSPATACGWAPATCNYSTNWPPYKPPFGSHSFISGVQDAQGNIPLSEGVMWGSPNQFQCTTAGAPFPFIPGVQGTPGLGCDTEQLITVPGAQVGQSLIVVNTDTDTKPGECMDGSMFGAPFNGHVHFTTTLRLMDCGATMGVTPPTSNSHRDEGAAKKDRP